MRLVVSGQCIFEMLRVANKLPDFFTPVVSKNTISFSSTITILGFEVVGLQFDNFRRMGAKASQNVTCITKMAELVADFNRWQGVSAGRKLASADSKG